MNPVLSCLVLFFFLQTMEMSPVGHHLMVKRSPEGPGPGSDNDGPNDGPRNGPNEDSKPETKPDASMDKFTEGLQGLPLLGPMMPKEGLPSPGGDEQSVDGSQTGNQAENPAVEQGQPMKPTSRKEGDNHFGELFGALLSPQNPKEGEVNPQQEREKNKQELKSFGEQLQQPMLKQNKSGGFSFKSPKAPDLSREKLEALLGMGSKKTQK